MTNTSRKTRVVSVRLPVDVVEIMERRVGKDWDSMNHYLRTLITREMHRDHHKKA